MNGVQIILGVKGLLFLMNGWFDLFVGDYVLMFVVGVGDFRVELIEVMVSLVGWWMGILL